jgi:hypothetical protein
MSMSYNFRMQAVYQAHRLGMDKLDGSDMTVVDATKMQVGGLQNLRGRFQLHPVYPI